MTGSELERYIRLYRDNVWAVALCRVKNPSDADDITQDIFLKLYTYGGSFESDEHVKAWLLRCTVNHSINLLKSGWHRLSQPIESAEAIAGGTNDENDLLPLIMQLSRKNRVTLYMYYYEGYSIEEISKLLGASDSAVKLRLVRARKCLKKLIEKDRKGYDDELQRDF